MKRILSRFPPRFGDCPGLPFPPEQSRFSPVSGEMVLASSHDLSGDARVLAVGGRETMDPGEKTPNLGMAVRFFTPAHVMSVSFHLCTGLAQDEVNNCEERKACPGVLDRPLTRGGGRSV